METQETKQIVKVKYYITDDKLSTTDYSYYSEAPLNVGDIITVPVRGTACKAQVSQIDVPESEVSAFKDKLKTITAVLTPAEMFPAVIPEPAEVKLELAGDAYMMEGKALISINPESDVTILSLLAQANRLRDYAIARVIATDDDMSMAVNDLSIIANVKKALTAKKSEYYKPIKVHLDAVTAMFGTLLTPIEDADRITRDKWTAYRNEQVRKKAEAEAINRAKEELAKREAVLNHGEITVDLTPVEAPMPIVRVQTDMGSAGVVRTRKYRVIDFAKLPDQYKIENSVLLKKVVKAGIPEIPGVEIYIEEGLRVSPMR